MVKNFRRYVYLFWRDPWTWQTDRHRVTAKTALMLCIASRGNKSKLRQIQFQSDWIQNQHTTTTNSNITKMSLEIQHKNQLAKSMLGPTRWLPTWDILIMDVGRFGWWDIFTNNHWDVLTETDWDVLTGGTFWLVTGTPIWSDLVIRVPHRHLADKSTRWQDNSLTNQLADTSTRGQDNSLTNNSLTVNSLTNQLADSRLPVILLNSAL